MSATGSCRVYNFGQKNHWRKWLWNRLIERLGSHNKHNKTILYLTGPEFNDYKWALTKGFKKKNLIGIDTDIANVKRLRDYGGIAIQSKLEDVLASWDSDRKIDIVIADMCCGHSLSVQFLEWSIIASCGLHENSIIAVNLLRGRDHNSHTVFKKAFDLGLFQICGYAPEMREKVYKHRGLRFIVSYIFSSSSYALGRGPADFQLYTPDRFKYIFETDLFPDFLSVMRPEYYSYKSNSGQYFDSVIFKRGHRVEYGNSFLFDKNDWNISDTKKKISAALALQTMAGF